MPQALKSIAKLSQKEQARVNAAFELLSDNPFPPNSFKLSGRKGYRVRLGELRIIYTVENKQLLITVIQVGHRREIYR